MVVYDRMTVHKNRWHSSVKKKKKKKNTELPPVTNAHKNAYTVPVILLSSYFNTNYSKLSLLLFKHITDASS